MPVLAFDTCSHAQLACLENNMELPIVCSEP